MSEGCPGCARLRKMLAMSAEERVAVTLVDMADEDGYLPETTVVEIARRAGVVRETAGRILSEWEAKDWIERRRRGGKNIIVSTHVSTLARAALDEQETRR